MIYLLRRRGLGRGSCNGIASYSQAGIHVVRNDAVPLPEALVVFRWGCTSTVPAEKIINRASAIHRSNNKRDFRLLLNEHELCPETWVDDNNLSFPLVVRPGHHAQGRHFHVCDTYDEFEVATAACGPNWYASRLIAKAAEYRVHVVQGRVVAVNEKSPNVAADEAWNRAQGGETKNVRWDSWPLEVIDIALQAFELSELDFGGVDVIVDSDGCPYVLEINTAPTLSTYRQQCFAKAFDYIVEYGNVKIPRGAEGANWKDYIHPAISEAAVIGAQL